MKKDCHTHPNVLNNPVQANEFIHRAISLGFDEIYFTDHMPFSLTGDEDDRIPIGGIGDYCKTVKKLAEEYEDKIRVRCGIEIDYHPDYTDEIESILEAGSFDFVLGSSHLGIKGYGYDLSKVTFEEYAIAVLNNYLSAAKSGYFSILTHLDYYRRPFAEGGLEYNQSDIEKSINSILHEIFLEMEKRGTSLEINAAPLYAGFDLSHLPYPHPDILSVAKGYRLSYTYGSDAHSADRVGYGYDKIQKIIDSMKTTRH